MQKTSLLHHKKKTILIRKYDQILSLILEVAFIYYILLAKNYHDKKCLFRI